MKKIFFSIALLLMTSSTVTLLASVAAQAGRSGS